MINDQEKIFKNVQKNYDKAIKCIRDLGKKVKESVETEDVEAAVRTYDYILQSILLKESLADNVVGAEEMTLIKNLVAQGDIMETIKKSVPEEYAPMVAWESVYLLPVEVQQLVSAKVDSLVSEYSDEFALFIALANMATRKDYAQVLADRTIDILTDFSLLSDGDKVQALEEGAEALNEMFIDKYLNVLRKIETFCSVADFVEAAKDFVVSELERYEKQAIREQRKAEIKEKFRSVFKKKNNE